ncbi:GNAT family N-acetyltransferase [Solirhodobacter olei]|uniref:GNAT family N-acetyltransferase n=1 Tax=Solirhodobacter olei TaxID=2493082 RepID=UPI000FDB776C|nr:GNAT family N-acetyltransferase [Solirhodobacter olei]
MEKKNDALIQIGEQSEIAAWASVWDAARPDVHESLELSSERNGGCLVLRAAKYPWWFMNRIIGLGIDSRADLDWLSDQIQRYRLAGTRCSISLCSEALPKGLEDHLTGNGLKCGFVLAKMMRQAEDLPDLDLSVAIREVGVDSAHLFGVTTVRGFGFPAVLTDFLGTLPGTQGWHTYLAYDADEPVGTGAFFVWGAVAWMGFDSVLSSHRRKGIHRALMLHRMHAAADLGCRWLVTEAIRPPDNITSPSLRNMHRLGFDLTYDRPSYVSGQ